MAGVGGHMVPSSMDAGASKRFWESHYQGSARPWSGIANPVLTSVALPLTPGRALDLGCSNGGDAIWLAQQGWQVIGVDVSTSVLEQARANAAIWGVSVRIDFQRHDLTESMPDGTFDLIVASYLHSPVAFPRPRILRSAAALLAPAGVFLDAIQKVGGRGEACER